MSIKADTNIIPAAPGTVALAIESPTYLSLDYEHDFDALVLSLPVIGWYWDEDCGGRGLWPVFPDLSEDEIYASALRMNDGRYYLYDFGAISEAEARKELASRLRNRVESRRAEHNAGKVSA